MDSRLAGPIISSSVSLSSSELNCTIAADDRLIQISDSQSIASIEVVDDDIVASQISNKNSEGSVAAVSGVFTLPNKKDNTERYVHNMEKNTGNNGGGGCGGNFSKKRSISESSVEKMAGSSKRAQNDSSSGAPPNGDDDGDILESSIITADHAYPRDQSVNKRYDGTSGSGPDDKNQGQNSLTPNTSSELIDLTYSDDEEFSDEGDLSTEDFSDGGGNVPLPPAPNCVPSLLNVVERVQQQMRRNDFAAAINRPRAEQLDDDSRPSCMLSSGATPISTTSPPSSTTIASPASQSSSCSYGSGVSSIDGSLIARMNQAISGGFWQSANSNGNHSDRPPLLATTTSDNNEQPRLTHQAPIPSPVLTPTLDVNTLGVRPHQQQHQQATHPPPLSSNVRDAHRPPTPYPPTPNSNPQNLLSPGPQGQPYSQYHGNAQGQSPAAASLTMHGQVHPHQQQHQHQPPIMAVAAPAPPPPTCHQYSCPHAMCNCHSHCPYCAQHQHSTTSSVVADVMGMGGHQQRYLVNCELHSPCPGHCPHSTHGPTTTTLLVNQSAALPGGSGSGGQSATTLTAPTPYQHQHYHQHHHLPCSRTPVICPAMTGYPMSVAAMSFYPGPAPMPPPQPQMIDVHHHHYVHPNDAASSMAAAAAAAAAAATVLDRPQLVSTSSVTLTLPPPIQPPPQPQQMARGQSPIVPSTIAAGAGNVGGGNVPGSVGPVPPLSQQRLLQRQQEYISRARDAQARWYDQRQQQQQRATAAAAVASFLPYHHHQPTPASVSVQTAVAADPGALGAAAIAAAAASTAARAAPAAAIYYHPYSAAAVTPSLAAVAAAAHTTAAATATFPFFNYQPAPPPPPQEIRYHHFDPSAAAAAAAATAEPVTVGRSIVYRPPTAAIATALAAAGLQQMWTTSVGPYVLVDRTTFPLESQFLRHMAESMDLPQGASSLLIDQCTTSLNYKVPDEKPVAGEEEKCPVCLCEFENDERVRSLPCAHLFHVDCIDRWLSTNKKCPVCRLNIDRYRQQQQQQQQHHHYHQQTSAMLNQQQQQAPPPLVVQHRHGPHT